MAHARFFYRDASAPTPNRPTSLGVVALIERDGSLLLECRKDCERWSLIGGGVQVNESLDGALAREVWEETGLTVAGSTLFGTFSDPSRVIEYPDGNVLRIVTLAYKVAAVGWEDLRCSAESVELKLFSRQELAGIDIVETHRHIVEDYLGGRPLVLK